MTLFGQKMWVALIMVGGLHLMSTLTIAAEVPDISAVINIKKFLDFWTTMDPMLYCITGDKHTAITTHNIPDGNDLIRFTESITPTKLSYTLDPDQDLVINVRDSINRISSWFRKDGGDDDQRIIISNGRLTIPHQQLQGSGIYTLRSYVYSHVSLLVRACPVNRIGKDCTVDVPYAAGVAVCVPHPVGCTCLPGYQGMWFEEECKRGRWGGNCKWDCQCSDDDCDKATGCNQENGEFAYQVIVGVSALVGVSVLVGVVGVSVWCWFW